MVGSPVVATRYEHLEHEVAAITRRLQVLTSQESLLTASRQENDQSINQSVGGLRGSVHPLEKRL